MGTTMKLLLTVVLMVAACLCASAQTTYRPTTWTWFGVPASTPQDAYDGNLSTYAFLQMITTDPAQQGTTWSGWSNPTGSRNHVTLQVLSQVSILGTDTGVPVKCKLLYSLDGGTTFNTIWGTQSPRAKQWDYVTLPVSQDLSKVQVRAAGWSLASCLGSA
jgi:hypothetical protein